MQCFNPRARVGRDAIGGGDHGNQYSFNPRARVGRDGETMEAMTRQEWFQSTRPRGARQKDSERIIKLAAVSIHAPAWGAT